MAPIDQKDSSTLPVFAKPVQRSDGQKPDAKTPNSESGLSNTFSQEVEKSNNRGETEETPVVKPLLIAEPATDQILSILNGLEDQSVKVPNVEVSKLPELGKELVDQVKSAVENSSVEYAEPSSHDKANSLPEVEQLVVTPIIPAVSKGIEFKEANLIEGEKLIAAIDPDQTVKADTETRDVAPSSDIGAKITPTISPVEQKPELVKEQQALAAVQKPLENTLPGNRDAGPTMVQQPIETRITPILENSRSETQLKIRDQAPTFTDLPAEEGQTELQKPLFTTTRSAIAHAPIPAQSLAAPIQAAPDTSIEPVMGDVELGRGIDLLNTKERMNSTNAIPQSTAQLNSAVARQIFGQVSAGLSQLGQGGIEIRLNPAELGRITIQILEGTMGQSANVLAEKPEVLDLLRRNENLLQNEFDGAGFESLSFNFDQQENEEAEPEQEFSSDFSDPSSDYQTSTATPLPISTRADLDIRL